MVYRAQFRRPGQPQPGLLTALAPRILGARVEFNLIDQCKSYPAWGIAATHGRPTCWISRHHEACQSSDVVDYHSPPPLGRCRGCGEGGEQTGHRPLSLEWAVNGRWFRLKALSLMNLSRKVKITAEEASHSFESLMWLIQG